MKNTNIVISLDTRRAKQDGSYPLIMRLGHNERTTSIPLGISVLEKDWDATNRLIKKSYSGSDSVSRLNNLIQKKKAEAMDIIFKLHESGELSALPVTDIRDRIASKSKNLSFYHYAEQVMNDLIQANRIGTARSIKGLISVLKTFHGKPDLQFQELNFKFLNRFEVAHRSKGNSANGLAVYMRTIRSIYNQAIKAGVADKELYPFNDYKIKTAPTEKRALDWDLLKRIISLDLAPEHICFNARNYFLASYMMYGMNFTDMASLRRGDISNGRILYRRKKTGKLYDIKINENLATILDYYKASNPESKYVFPIIKREEPLLRERDIMWARKRYNKKLKELAILCGIEHNLTSYVSRHSFATQAMLQDVPLSAISTMLGHSSLKTTEIYLKSLPSNVLDDYNSKIMMH